MDYNFYNMYYDSSTFIFWNDEIVNAEDAKIDLYSQTMHYGLGVFEGIRSYETVAGKTQIFKANEHFARLQRSAELVNIPYEWDNKELIAATYKILSLNEIQDAYIRPLVYSPANMSFNLNEKSFIVIETWKMAPFLGEKLLRVMTSSFERPNPKGFMIEAKVTGHYVNSILASQEAKAKGFDEALLKDLNGHIAEGPGANIFIEKDKVLYTPVAGNILPGITRATVMELCEEMNIPVVEKQISPGELKEADSAFFCGTAAEVIGIESIDDAAYSVEWPSSLGSQIQMAYKNLVTEKTFFTTESYA